MIMMSRKQKQHEWFIREIIYPLHLFRDRKVEERPGQNKTMGVSNLLPSFWK